MKALRLCNMRAIATGVGMKRGLRLFVFVTTASTAKPAELQWTRLEMWTRVGPRKRYQMGGQFDSVFLGPHEWRAPRKGTLLTGVWRT